MQCRHLYQFKCKSKTIISRTNKEEEEGVSEGEEAEKKTSGFKDVSLADNWAIGPKIVRYY